MSPKVYLIDTTGGVKYLSFETAQEKLKEGWIMLPQSQIGLDGKPKQWFYPQYNLDGHPIKEVTPEVSIEKDKQRMLQVDIM